MVTYLESFKSLKNAAENKSQLKYYSFICMVVVVILCACDSIVYKPIKLTFLADYFGRFGNIPASAIIYPIAYYLIDISTEVYGFELTRKIIHRLIFCNLFFMVLVYTMTQMPSDPSWQNQYAYDIVFGNLPKLFLASTAGLTVGTFANSIIVSKLKILLHGKKYWLRSLVASSIGQLITCIASYLIIFGGNNTIVEIIDFVLSAWIYKSLIMLIFWAPNCVIAKMLKQAEGLDHYDYGVKYNIISFDSIRNKFKTT